ncbi:hypothetical protein [Brevibacillus migulae]|uniref:hypothetical protein n=1 Tax=Brevibacillus migulae TaxID=1644114 RepID=UPI00106EF8B1|nr:hypothetical protein [Brevibacillus migulae]
MFKEMEMELLQRDLDGDLTMEEKESLRVILAKNPDLQLMYNRMQKVSRQLADLPPVTPAFSLVDSILPELEKEKKFKKPVPVMAKLEREELPTLEWKKPQEQEAAKFRRLPAWFSKVGSGVAAACLLFGLFFLMKDAGLDKPGTGSQTGGTVVVNPVSSQTEAPAQQVAPTVVKPVVQTVTPPPKSTPKTKTEPSKTQTPANKAPVKKQSAVTQKPATKPAVPAVPAEPVDRGPIFPGAGSSMPGATSTDIETVPSAEKTSQQEKGNSEEAKGKVSEKKEEKEAKKEEKEADKEAKKEEKSSSPNNAGNKSTNED